MNELDLLENRESNKRTIFIHTARTSASPLPQNVKMCFWIFFLYYDTLQIGFAEQFLLSFITIHDNVRHNLNKVNIGKIPLPRLIRVNQYDNNY